MFPNDIDQILHLQTNLLLIFILLSDITTTTSGTQVKLSWSPQSSTSWLVTWTENTPHLDTLSKSTFQNFTSVQPVKRGMTYDIIVKGIDWQYQSTVILQKEYRVKWH